MARKKTTKEEIHWRNRAEAYKKYAHKLKQELEMARSTLKDLSVGLVPTGLALTWSHQTKMQYAAATHLENRMVPDEPEGYWYP